MITKSARALSLRAALERELESATVKQGLDQRNQLRWLGDQLENYLDRWLAFSAVESIDIKSLLRDDLFTMVNVATELYGEHRERNIREEPKAKDWYIFTSLLERIQSLRDRSLVNGLRPSLLAELRLNLHKPPSKTPEIPE